MLSYKTYQVCFFLGWMGTIASTPLVIRLARRAGAVDLPRNRKVHAVPMPLWGGLGVFVGMWIPLALLFFYNNEVTEKVQDVWPSLAMLCVAGMVMMATGMVDDRWGMRPRKKLMVQLVVAVGLLLFGVQFKNIVIPGMGAVPLGPFAPLVTLLWIVGITNAVNLIDGLDGLAAGTAFIIAATNAFMAAALGNILLATIMFSLAGACLGFLQYNFNPARIFLGDTGSLLLGVTLALSSILCTEGGSMSTSLLIPAVALGYPAMDTLLSMARRIATGKPIFSADRSHIHHRLLRYGFTVRQAVFSLYALCALFCLLALAIISEDLKAVAAAMFALISMLVMGAHALGYIAAFRRRFGSPQEQEVRSAFQFAHHMSEAIKAKIYLSKTLEEVIALLPRLCEEMEMDRLQMIRNVSIDSGARKSCQILDWHNPNKIVAEVASTQTDAPIPSTVMPSEVPEDQGLKLDNYTFANTGLEVKVYYRNRADNDGLLMEHRIRVGEVIETANHRLEVLIQQGAKADLSLLALQS